MRRHLIGILALLSLLGAAALAIWSPAGTSDGVLQSGLGRGGILAAIVWLAYGDVHRIPRWLWGVLLGILVVVAFRPKTVLFAIPLIIALAILKPRLGRRR